MTQRDENSKQTPKVSSRKNVGIHECLRTFMCIVEKNISAWKPFQTQLNGKSTALFMELSSVVQFVD